jgi:hypothetical protein
MGDTDDNNIQRIRSDHSDNSMQFQVNNSERMRIDSSGRVGIGTTNPSNTLTVNKDTGSTPTVYINNSGVDATDGPALKVQASGRGAGIADVSVFSVHNISDEIFTVRNDGNVGIGTTSPATLIHARASSPILTLQADDGNVCQLLFGDASDLSRGNITYDNSDESLQFKNNNNQERMRIDSSGNVGIGTSSPSSYYATDLVVNCATEGGITLVGGTTDVQYLMFADGTSGNAQYRGFIGYDHNVEEFTVNSRGEILFNSGSTATEAMRIDASGDIRLTGTAPNAEDSISTVNFYNSSSSLNLASITGKRTAGGTNYGSLIFNTTSAGSIAERMRIDSSGNLLVGTTSTPSGSVGGAALMANNQIIASRGSAAALALYRPDSNGDVALFHKGSTQVGSISVTGAATAYNTSSDVRLKENIVDAPAGNIDDIRVRSFDWKADRSHQTYGMVAQELVDVAPEAVTQGNTEDDLWSVDYSKLVPMMIKEIQDLKAEVAALKGA